MPELPEHASLEDAELPTLAERIVAEEQDRPAPMQGLNRFHYAWLLLAGLEDSKDSQKQMEMDSKTWTLLNADAACLAGDFPRVPGAGFYPGYARAYFGEGDPGGRLRLARVRRAVGGDAA